MKRRKHTPDQVVRKLREDDRLLAEGKVVAEVAKHLEISEQTYHRWRNQYGCLKGRRRQAPQGAQQREHASQAHRGRQGARDRRP